MKNSKTAEPVKLDPYENVLSIKGLLNSLGTHINALMPENSPTKESVAACRATSTAINSNINVIKLAMKYSEMTGQKPNLGFLQITDGPKE